MPEPATITIRAGRPGDAPSLAALGSRVFAETFGAVNSPSDMALYLSGAYGLAQQSAELADPRIGTLLAASCARARHRGASPAPGRSSSTGSTWTGRGKGRASRLH